MVGERYPFAVPRWREPNPEHLEESRDPRVARQQLSKLEVSVNYLEHAARLKAKSDEPDPELQRIIERARNDCLQLKGKCSGRIESRRRPKANRSEETCTVYIDECGQHAVAAKDAFPVFVLAAAIIRDVDYPVIDAAWKRWKHDSLGSDVVVHEPDLRRRDGPFRGHQYDEAVGALPGILSQFEFTGIAVVVHRADYVADYGTGPIDDSLPEHAYMLALDFLTERVALALDTQFSGAKARFVVEARGAKEDTLLQYEFARLHLDGTSYISPSWFRQQLNPGIEFLLKADNNTGLQVADLFARPVAEKVAKPESDPPRWSTFRDKLCTGQETKHSILGLKIVPWRDHYDGIWKS